jgi:hypothetical protein
MCMKDISLSVCVERARPFARATAAASSRLRPTARQVIRFAVAGVAEWQLTSGSASACLSKLWNSCEGPSVSTVPEPLPRQGRGLFTSQMLPTHSVVYMIGHKDEGSGSIAPK